MDVAEWLRGLGLERYEAAFRDNEIDWEALPKLSAEDLKDLGVVLGGHRRRLLDAIAALRAEPTPAVTAAPAGGSPLPNPPSLAGERRVGAEAERRQLTVMFCDLVGSTARICARSSAPITAPPPMSSGASTALSRNIWATASWSISATRERMRTMPSGQFGRGWVSSTLLAISI